MFNWDVFGIHPVHENRSKHKGFSIINLSKILMGKRRITTKATRRQVYAAAQYLNLSVEKELGIRIPFDVYLQDPLVAKNDPKFGFDTDFYVRWEPDLTDGPTSSRFAIVDYNGDTGYLAPKAKWDEKKEQFLDTEGKVLDENNSASLQFHQLNVWAVLQSALAFYEEGQGLGRSIPFGFEGNRLIVLPHAGYGQNAFYDRTSKTLQFYYFDNDGKRVYTCLSSDIINHEFGHAILDGIRPYYIESSLVETGAFHEFIGDLTAILIILRNNVFRGRLAENTKGQLSEAAILSSIAQEFGEAVSDNPYLRTAQNDLKMSDVSQDDGPHKFSQVMTGAMFDILLALSEFYIQRALEKATTVGIKSDRGRVAKTQFYNAIQEMQHLAIQPLDLLPPVDVTFKDYALAILRAQEIANPKDPHEFYPLILEIFRAREILNDEDVERLQTPAHLYNRLDLDIYHDIDDISRSKSKAYEFLNDNRSKLFIPLHQDIIIADLYASNKLTRQGRRLSRQIIIAYLWREEVLLGGDAYEEFNGERTSMLCGGTLVFDDNGSLLSWSRKPGVECTDLDMGKNKKWADEIAVGEQRKSYFLENLKKRIAFGEIGASLGSSKGMVGSLIPPLTVDKKDGLLKFQLSPHLRLNDDHKHPKSKKRWEVSS